MIHFVENVTSQEICLEICQETEGCKWFTYASSYYGCQLMADCETLDESCKECLSGEVTCDQGKLNWDKANTNNTYG